MYPRYLRLAMGHSHSVHILMSINITAAGRALQASRRLLGDVPCDDAHRPQQFIQNLFGRQQQQVEDRQCKLLTPQHDHGSIFEAAKKSVHDDDETTAPSVSEGSCGDVFDDG